MRTSRQHGDASFLQKIRPASIAVVDVIERQFGTFQKLGEPRLCALTDPFAKLARLFSPARRDRLADIPQHDIGCHTIELHVAASRQEGKPLRDLPLQLLSRAAEQRQKSSIEAKLAPMLADEIEHRARRLAIGASQTAAKLLQKQRR